MFCGLEWGRTMPKSWQGGWRLRIATVLVAAVPVAAQDAVGGEPAARPALFSGHGSTVDALVITPDGKTLVSGSLDNNIKLWDLTTCQERATLRGHPGGVVGLALTRDGRTLASASNDTIVKLWKMPSGRDIGTLKTGTRVGAIVFSPDGQTLVTAGESVPIKLWDVRTRTERASLHPGYWRHTKDVLITTSLAMTAGGSTLFSGHLDGTVRVWDLTAGKLRMVIRADQSLVFCMALSPDERTLAFVSVGGPITLWDLSSGKCRAKLPYMPIKAMSVAFSPSGRLLVSGGHDGKVRLWDVATTRQLNAFPGSNWNDSLVGSVAFTPDGKTLYAGSGREMRRGEVERWDMSAYEAPSEGK
jgi:WD40 repeat protein